MLGINKFTALMLYCGFCHCVMYALLCSGNYALHADFEFKFVLLQEHHCDILIINLQTLIIIL